MNSCPLEVEGAHLLLFNVEVPVGVSNITHSCSPCIEVMFKTRTAVFYQV